jgi:hypothetical protein
MIPLEEEAIGFREPSIRGVEEPQDGGGKEEGEEDEEREE